MHLLEQQLSSLKIDFNLTDDCITKIKQQCCAHAINCSMDVKLLEESSVWLVDQIMMHIEKSLSLSAVNHVHKEQEKIIKEETIIHEKIAAAGQMIQSAAATRL